MKAALLGLAVALLCSCATTVSTTDHLTLGMTQQQVQEAAGRPYRKSASMVNGTPAEQWIYRETTWDQGGWSWNRTVMDTAVVFQNGRVVSYGPYQERHLIDNPMRPTMNLNVTTAAQ